MKRRGVFLIELMLVMTACSIVLTLSATLLHRLMRAQSESQRLLDGERSALRLTRQLRADAAWASTVEINPDVQSEVDADSETRSDGPSLRLGQAALGPAQRRVVEYRLAGGVVYRKQELPNGGTARELYRLGPAATWTVKELSSPRRIEVVMDPVSADAVGPLSRPTALRIEARVGWLAQAGQQVEQLPLLPEGTP